MPSLKKNLLLATSLAATTQAQTFGNYSTISNVTSSACPAPGTAHIIVARASLEPLGYGVIGAVKDNVLAALPGSNAEYVVYPATLTDYFTSEQAGVLGMKALAEAYIAKNCAEPLVLMGYSQGAQVTADYISGQNDNGFPYNATLTDPAPASVLDKLAAAVIMGDPSMNVTDNPFHVGNSTKGGVYIRDANSSAVLDSIESKLQSYCDANDPYCASGNFSYISVHLGYVEEYGTNATDFVVAKIKEWYANSTSSGNGTNATTTGTAGNSTYTGGAAEMTSGMRITLVLAFVLGGAFLGGL